MGALAPHQAGQTKHRALDRLEVDYVQRSLAGGSFAKPATPTAMEARPNLTHSGGRWAGGGSERAAPLARAALLAVVVGFIATVQAVVRKVGPALGQGHRRAPALGADPWRRRGGGEGGGRGQEEGGLRTRQCGNAAIRARRGSVARRVNSARVVTGRAGKPHASLARATAPAQRTQRKPAAGAGAATPAAREQRTS